MSKENATKKDEIVIFDPPILFAFWSYDLPPYVVGGSVTRMLPSGSVETKEYGSGRYYRPIRLLPLEEGKTLKKALDEMSDAYSKEDKKLRATWSKRFEAVFQGRDKWIKIA